MENDYVMPGEESCREKLGLLQVYAEKWELSEIEFQPALSGNNLIFYAVSRRYGRVIFKILLNNGFDKEIFALRLFQGRNFCSLYEYSLEDMVYLMERIVPADTLFEGTSRRERIAVAVAIFPGLHMPALADAPFPTYSEWLQAGRDGTKDRKDCASLLPYLEKAETIIQEISRKYPRRMLLHGDLHHENILKNETGGYTVIDPKGVIGDPVFDLSRFILDEFRDDLRSEPKEAVLDFVRELGCAVNIPCEILLGCLYAETVIWLFREQLAAGESMEECAGLIENMKTADELLCEYGEN